MKVPPTFPEILAADERIRASIRRTPVLRCASLDRLAGAELHFKAEHLQKGGAFKFRGATNAVLSLSDADARGGVATHSSGNHAQALALAARSRGLAAHIVMPENASEVKRRAVEEYGGRVVSCGPTLDSREERLREVLAETGAHEIHPYDDPRVIAGAATAALELMREVPDLDFVAAPVGGGGLLSGAALAAAGLRPKTKILGAEPFLADDAHASLKAGRRLPPKPALTAADGLRTALSELTFSILRRARPEILRAEEKEIFSAMRLIWERAKWVVEPSAAVVLAGLLRERGKYAGAKIGIILSGGNVDVTRFKTYF